MLSRLYLIRKELAGGKFISFIVFCVIMLSVTAIASFNILSDNFNNYIKNNFASSIPPDEIVVKPGEGKSIFLFSTGTGRELNSSAIRKIRSIPGVKSVEPVLVLTVPTSATIYFFTFQYRTDLVCAGADYRYVAGDLKSEEMKKAWRTGTHEKGIPVLVPKGLIDSYNNGLAAANSLPEIVPDRLSGLKFKLSFGRSSVSSVDNAFDSSSVVAGYTDRINITGLVIPLKAAEELNRRFSKPPKYMSATVKVKDHKDFESVKKSISRMELVIETGDTLSAEILRLKSTVNTFITLMISLVSLMAIVTTALCSMTAVWGRIDYYRIMRALGASRFFIALTILIKFAVMGFLASWGGLFVLQNLKVHLLQSFSIPGVKLSLELSAATMATITTAGTLVPVAASLPAIIRMFAVKLDRD